MKKIPILLVAIGIGLVLFIAALRKGSPASAPLELLRQRYARKHVPSVDHTKLPALQRVFSSPQQVTEACVSCHTESSKEVMQSSHWNWERAEYIPGRGVRYIGKKNIINNFCIGVSPNLQECDACHAGYGWVDEGFDFSNWRNIDCLACHDNSNTYLKGMGGYPDPSVNLTTVAQHVGRPLRTNCGTCHFFGGGGNNVKHGDLEKALFDAGRDVDVHMASEGEDMQCVACHTAENHRMLGKMYSVSSMNRNRSSCEQCHTAAPHNEDMLNEHVSKVSCQACHIPEYAKVGSTRLSWDWSAAGKLKDGKPYAVKDSLGNDAYLSIKGAFVWGRNVKPEYVWFNGTAGHYLLGDTVSGDRPIAINSLYGSYDDPDAKIVPVKVQRSVQIYDPVNRILIEPKLFAEKTGEGAFWKDFDWNRAAEEGMKTVHLPYSGRYTFVRTEMTWPVNHMVSPKEKAVSCTECHTRTNGRLANLGGFYMPGRDYSATVDTLGIGALLVVMAGIVVHASARVFLRKSHRRELA